MTPESIEWLKSRVSMWETFKAVQVIPHLPVDDASKLLNIAKEIDEKYTGTIWCQSCLVDVVKFVFSNFEKTEEYKALTAPEPEKTIIKTSFDTKKKK